MDEVRDIAPQCNMHIPRLSIYYQHYSENQSKWKISKICSFYILNSNGYEKTYKLIVGRQNLFMLLLLWMQIFGRKNECVLVDDVVLLEQIFY